MNKGIKNWPEEERPREKLFSRGEHNLTDTELLAIILRSGSKEKSALDLAREILQKFKTFRNMSHTELSCWKDFKGLGKAKLATLKAAIEIGRRFQEQEVRDKKPKISSSRDVAHLLMGRMRDLKKEVFKILLLNSKNRIIDIVEIEEGGINEAYPIIREIITKALQNFSAGIICVHNHPSGDPIPSSEDINFTNRLKNACQIMQIELLDHIIIGDNVYYSLKDKGVL